jgi:hypothetical protein
VWRCQQLCRVEIRWNRSITVAGRQQSVSSDRRRLEVRCLAAFVGRRQICRSLQNRGAIVSSLVRSAPGNWQISNNGFLIENSFIGPTKRASSCASKDVYGTTMLFKRADPILRLDRDRWYYRVKFELRDPAGWAGAVFAYNGVNNHFRVATRVADQCVSLQKRENGRWTNLANGRIRNEPLAVKMVCFILLFVVARSSVVFLTLLKLCRRTS